MAGWFKNVLWLGTIPRLGVPNTSSAKVLRNFFDIFFYPNIILRGPKLEYEKQSIMKTQKFGGLEHVLASGQNVNWSKDHPPLPLVLGDVCPGMTRIFF